MHCTCIPKRNFWGGSIYRSGVAACVSRRAESYSGYGVWNRWPCWGHYSRIALRGVGRKLAIFPVVSFSHAAYVCCLTARQGCVAGGEESPRWRRRTNCTAAEILLSSVQNARQQQQTDEVAGYSREPPADINTNPLAWWKSNGARYPRLAVLALKYLGIPATSVPSERIFSKAGEIVSRRRASLKPSTVDMLVFLSKNLTVTD